MVKTPTWRKYLEEQQFEDGFQKSAELAKFKQLLKSGHAFTLYMDRHNHADVSRLCQQRKRTSQVSDIPDRPGHVRIRVERKKDSQ